MLDHHILGTAPLRVSPIEAGPHHLRVSAGPDYKPFILTVQVLPGHVARVDARLETATEAYLKAGVAAAHAGRPEEALPLLEWALQGTPRQPEAWWWIGRLKLERGDRAGALQAFRGYANYYPNRSQVYLYLGSLHESLGDRASAVTAYKLALLRTEALRGALATPPAPTWSNIRRAGNPRSPAAQLQLAWLYEQKGRMGEALHWLRAAVRTVFGDWREAGP